MSTDAKNDLAYVRNLPEVGIQLLRLLEAIASKSRAAGEHRMLASRIDAEVLAMKTALEADVAGLWTADEIQAAKDSSDEQR